MRFKRRSMRLPIIEYGQLSWRGADSLQVQLRLRNRSPESVSLDEASVLRPRRALIANTERSNGEGYDAAVSLGHRLEPAGPHGMQGTPAHPDPVILNLCVRLPRDYPPGKLLRIKFAISTSRRVLRRMRLVFNATIPGRLLLGPEITAADGPSQ